jgi:O-methyltransferase
MAIIRNSSALRLSSLGVVRLALRQYGVLGATARFLMLRDELSRFVTRGASSRARAERRHILGRFAAIHAHVACAHSPLQFAIIAEHLLGLDVQGDIVQCGSYKGGSTAKLSILAKLTNRKLYVCDSFAGLPRSEDGDRVYVSLGDQADYVFAQGEYAGSLAEVRANVSRFGEIDVCTFVPGWFADTLPTLEVRPAFVFTDVDYVSSARNCLRWLWPRLAPAGLWFTHEAMFLTYIEGIMDPDWWMETLHTPPPVLVGGGAGLSAAAPSLAYFRKSPALRQPLAAMLRG